MTLSPNWSHDSGPRNGSRIPPNTWREEIDSGGGTIGENSAISRLFYVDGDGLQDFITSLLGYSYIDGGGMHRVLPEPHPLDPRFICTDVAISPVQRQGGTSVVDNVSKWNWWRVGATFRPVAYVLKQDPAANELDRYVIREYKPRAEPLIVNGRFFFTQQKINGKPVPLDAPPSITLASTQARYTWVQIPCDSRLRPFNFATVLGTLGKSNQATFDGIFPAQTVALVDFETTFRLPRFGGDLYYVDLAYIFDIRDNGTDGGSGEAIGVNWVYNINVDPARWELVTNTGETSGTRIYPPADFSQLFKAT